MFQPPLLVAQDFGSDKIIVLMNVTPHTGRTHQIRAHMASTGRPLLGDIMYGLRGPVIDTWCPRLFLHCWRLQLLGIDSEPITITSKLPAELTAVLSTLRELSATDETSSQNPPRSTETGEQFEQDLRQLLLHSGRR